MISTETRNEGKRIYEDFHAWVFDKVNRKNDFLLDHLQSKVQES